jgi:HPt (histidine-containing phosphotransfer) domain-containing protein
LFGIESTDGKKFSELISDKIQLPGDEKSQMQAAIDSFLGEPDFAFEVNSDALPREFKIVSQTEEKYIEADWLPLVENDTINGFMTTFRDVTTLRELKKQAESERERNDMILQLVSQAKTKPLNFFQMIQEDLKKSKDLLFKDPALAKRILHTIKGNSRAKGFKQMAQCIHELETELASAKTEVNVSLLEPHFENGHEVSGVYLKLLNDELQALSKISDSYSQKESLLGLLKGTIKESEQILQLAGVKLEFECPDGIEFDEADYQKISSICVHLLNNAMAHGISKQEQSSDKCVKICLRKNELVVEDSGPGLNLNFLESKAKTQKFNWNTEDELAKLVFESGVSSAEKVGAISGRGVGMDAVKHDVESLGGNIFAEFQSPRNESGFRKFAWKLNWKVA